MENKEKVLSLLNEIRNLRKEYNRLSGIQNRILKDTSKYFENTYTSLDSASDALRREFVELTLIEGEEK